MNIFYIFKAIGVDCLYCGRASYLCWDCRPVTCQQAAQSLLLPAYIKIIQASQLDRAEGPEGSFLPD